MSNDFPIVNGYDNSLNGIFDGFIAKFSLIENIKCFGKEPTIIGINGNDIIVGGNDKMHGNKGNDYLYGDDGNDRLTDNNGNDTIYGGLGNDKIFGYFGNDTIYGDNPYDSSITGYDTANGGPFFDLCDTEIMKDCES